MYTAREYARAFNIFNRLQAQAKSPRAIIKCKNYMAWCLHNVGNPEESIQILNSLVSEWPDEPLPWLYNGIYYIKTDKIKSAKKCLQTGIEKFPDQLELYLTLASLHKDKERSDESIKVLKKALAQDKLSRGKGIIRKDIWAELGSLYYNRGDYNSSLACLKKSMRMDFEENFLHYDLLAHCYIKLDDPRNCLDSIEKYLLYLGEIDQDILLLKSRALCKLDMCEEAEHTFLQAYSIEDCIELNNHELYDLALLQKKGVFTGLDVEYD